MLTDYKNLKYFIIICKLNHCQVYWNEFFLKFNFNIIYWLRVINSVTDVLICCAGNCLCNKKNFQNAYQYQIIFEDQQFQLNMFNIYNSDMINVTIVAAVIF